MWTVIYSDVAWDRWESKTVTELSELNPSRGMGVRVIVRGELHWREALEFVLTGRKVLQSSANAPAGL